MTKKQIFAKINAIIKYWRNEGDTASSHELFHEAILHLKWKSEKVKGVH